MMLPQTRGLPRIVCRMSYDYDSSRYAFLIFSVSSDRLELWFQLLAAFTVSVWHAATNRPSTALMQSSIFLSKLPSFCLSLRVFTVLHCFLMFRSSCWMLLAKRAMAACGSQFICGPIVILAPCSRNPDRSPPSVTISLQRVSQTDVWRVCSVALELWFSLSRGAQSIDRSCWMWERIPPEGIVPV